MGPIQFSTYNFALLLQNDNCPSYRRVEAGLANGSIGISSVSTGNLLAKIAFGMCSELTSLATNVSLTR